MLSSQQNSSSQWVTARDYRKGAYFDTVKGGLYQLKLCMLLAHRALQQGASFDFALSSEHDGFHRPQVLWTLH